ncbi:imm11 family protein [Polyangium fumosum]|uniref:Immunity MXAN-0049 protein domain-containing protein n=1 Tax=Polyangium fumosum TaxID=889272 RepID=A0A4V5PQJ0_9BACT|nr:DUF1629 domain-containing protein [Polyangium fumosum]TKD12808.1 hypothetical protein E8A74_03415 [Polyangium fumosum]
MVIYEPIPAEHYECVNAIHSEEYEVFREFDGSPRAATWKPIAVRRVRADKRQGFKPSDFPSLGFGPLVMRRTAVDALRDILEANGEVLPLSTDDGVELYVLNARVIDALDEANSTLRRIPGTDRIMWIKKPAFFASAIEGVDLFRLPHRGSSTYVSERFVERVKAAGLRGLDFNEVWSG